MDEVLLCWLGDTDYDCANVALPGREIRPQKPGSLGPVAGALVGAEYDRVVLLNNRAGTESQASDYVRWLEEHTSATPDLRQVPLGDPTDHAKIYEAVLPICEAEKAKGNLTFHLSPGTPSMAAIWLLLAKTIVPATLIQTSRQRGVQEANVPFDISAELLPMLNVAGAKLGQSSEEKAPKNAAFSDILHRSAEMKQVIRLAQRVAIWPVPVLIEGESGTGKELFARAIHDASQRSAEAFVPVNCGAIPKDLVESVLFGHERGAFTGADKQSKGVFEQASTGTLFLDELGELPLDAQVKLLRVLETGTVRRVGGDKSIKVDVRVVAATNRSLIQEVSDGAFREDLFYRLAVTRLKLPPLRDRQGDIGLLLESALASINEEGAAHVPGYKQKKLSAGAKNLLLKQPWRGNVRELKSTVRRAAIWCEDETLSEQDAQQALLEDARDDDSILGRSLGEGFDVKGILSEVAAHYITQAMAQAGGVKKEAAALLGLNNATTLTNWMKTHGVTN